MPRSILIADDSVTIRRVVELAFSDTDVRVESAGGGNEALAKFSTLKPDLVLADVVMPAPDGYEICRVVKSSDRPVPVLLLAGTFEPLDPQRAKLCGADGHLVKPFDSRLLVAQVAKRLGTGSTGSAGTVRTAGAGPAGRPAEDDLEDMFDDLAGVPAPGRDGASADSREDEAAASGRSDATAVIAQVPRTSSVAGLDAAAIDAIVAQVVARLSDRVLREIAWDVVPDMAETIIRERLQELERDDEVR